MRKNGILLHISSLPSKYGIGSFGKSAFDFVDFLHDAKVNIWQVLPIDPTSYGDSPYQSFSTFAGNPYFIDLDFLVEDGILNECDLPKSYENAERVDYEKLYYERYVTLKKAFAKSFHNFETEIREFEKSQDWLSDYALFMALKGKFGGISWQEWQNEYKMRDQETLEKAKIELKDEIDFQLFMQFFFNRQWFALKKYANDKNVEICGDMPIYVALDSSDVWSSPQNFQLDSSLSPSMVAGVPPDYFSEDGQLWGNPLFDWEYLEKTNFSWWLTKLALAGTFFDVVRLDHFIGFAKYYSIPASSNTAKIGEWKKGTGESLFDEVMKKRPDAKIIAEDLGALSEDVIKLRDKYNFPGMSVLQFCFDPKEGAEMRPYEFKKNSVVYTGTHDNDTILGWWQTQNQEMQSYVLKYLNVESDKNIVDNLIDLVLGCDSDTAIIPLQDYLHLGTEARMNVPGTLGENWKWRFHGKMLTDELKNYILTKNMKFNRA